MGDQTPPIDPREVKRADQLDRGDIVVNEYQPGCPEYREVRHVEPTAEDPARVLVVYRGAETENLRCAAEVEIAGPEEYDKYRATIRDDEKRARMRSGLMKLIEALDAGLPLPAYFDIDGSCTPTAEAVREVAKTFGVEPEESVNAGAPQIRARVILAADPNGRREVELDFWHLGPRPVES